MLLNILREIAESRTPVYCSYALEKRSYIPGLVRHNPFYRSKGYPLFIPNNYNTNENIFDYCIVCTKDEHSVLEDISRVGYGIKSKLTEHELDLLKTILPNSEEVNTLIRINKDIRFYSRLSTIAKSKARLYTKQYSKLIKIIEKRNKNKEKLLNSIRFKINKSIIYSIRKHYDLFGIGVQWKLDYAGMCAKAVKNWTSERKEFLSKRNVEYWKTHDNILTTTFNGSKENSNVASKRNIEYWRNNTDKLNDTINRMNSNLLELLKDSTFRNNFVNNCRDAQIKRYSDPKERALQAERFKNKRTYHNCVDTELRLSPEDTIPDGFIPGRLHIWKKNNIINN